MALPEFNVPGFVPPEGAAAPPPQPASGMKAKIKAAANSTKSMFSSPMHALGKLAGKFPGAAGLAGVDIGADATVGLANAIGGLDNEAVEGMQTKLQTDPLAQYLPAWVDQAARGGESAVARVGDLLTEGTLTGSRQKGIQARDEKMLGLDEAAMAANGKLSPETMAILAKKNAATAAAAAPTASAGVPIMADTDPEAGQAQYLRAMGLVPPPGTQAAPTATLALPAWAGKSPDEQVAAASANQRPPWDPTRFSADVLRLNPDAPVRAKMTHLKSIDDMNAGYQKALNEFQGRGPGGVEKLTYAQGDERMQAAGRASAANAATPATRMQMVDKLVADYYALPAEQRTLQALQDMQTKVGTHQNAMKAETDYYGAETGRMTTEQIPGIHHMDNLARLAQAGAGNTVATRAQDFGLPKFAVDAALAKAISSGNWAEAARLQGILHPKAATGDKKPVEDKITGEVKGWFDPQTGITHDYPTKEELLKNAEAKRGMPKAA